MKSEQRVNVLTQWCEALRPQVITQISGVTAGETATLFSLGYEPVPRQRARRSLDTRIGSLTAYPQLVVERGQREPHRPAPVTAGETATNSNMTHGRFIEPWVCQRRARSRSGPQLSGSYPGRTYASPELSELGVTGVERHAPNSNPRLAPPTQSRLSNGQRELAQAHAGPRDAVISPAKPFVWVPPVVLRADREKKPQRGYWRNLWKAPHAMSDSAIRYYEHCGCTIVDAWRLYGGKKWATRDEASHQARTNPNNVHWEHLSIDFFPEASK